tara:strand:+ start:4266 stop:5534 length:1269 start_codon:yes stop_codon:yes gene_type:complete
MDKRKLIFLLVISLFYNAGLAEQSRTGQKRKKAQGNINRFILAPFSHAVHKDSIKIVAFIEIPFFALQFIKTGKQFTASYEASIALLDKKGREIGHNIWTDSITVTSYLAAKSIIKNRKHFTSFIVPKGQFELMGELQDADTRKRGTQKQKLDFRKLSDQPSLLKPTFLLSLAGDWGFEKNLIPTRGHRVRKIGTGTYLLISGFVDTNPYKVKAWIEDLNKSGEYLDTLSGDGRNGYFSQAIFISSDQLSGLKNDITIELEQEGRIANKEITFSIYKPGISNYVDDVDRAMKQMKYILTNEERKQFKGKNRKEKKQLFYDLWKDRDPTPETEYNELMEEYYGRVWYANENFDAWAPGWETDMGMIYILFGPPDDIQRSNPSASNSVMYQMWSYYRLSKQFVFKDQNGFGDYRLDSPFMGAGF